MLTQTLTTMQSSNKQSKCQHTDSTILLQTSDVTSVQKSVMSRTQMLPQVHMQQHHICTVASSHLSKGWYCLLSQQYYHNKAIRTWLPKDDQIHKINQRGQTQWAHVNAESRMLP